ncbi:MAG: hypothetical protein QOE19_1468 [Actinomycetota bacterium]|nr:hypothetical protein [Actinomycetota bacterium]
MVLDWQRVLLAIATVGVLMLLLRWAYGNGRSRTSLVERRPTAGRSNEYGLLVPIAAPGNYIEGEMLCRRLEDAGIRTNLVSTVDGPRVMVFPEDESIARQLLAS